MPRADPWCDGGIRKWEDFEFYCDNLSGASASQPTVESAWVSPAVQAAETLCFILGPEGIALSAGIGVLHASVQPKRIKTYNESTRTAITNAIQEGLDNHEFKKATNDIVDFQNQVETTYLLSENLGKDDFVAMKDEHLVYLTSAVQAGGVLQRAFDTCRDNIVFDGKDRGQRTLWTVAAAACIFQAYKLRIAAYSQMARYWRGKSDAHKYNETLAFIRTAYVELNSHLPKLCTSAEHRVQAAMQERRAAVVADYNTFETQWVDRAFGSADREVAKSRSFVRDDKTKRRLQVGGLFIGTNYSDGVGIPSSKNDHDLVEFARINVKDYREKVNVKMRKDSSVLKVSLAKVRDVVAKFLQDCAPVKPQYAPSQVTTTLVTPTGTETVPVTVPLTHTIPIGSRISFRYFLVTESGKPLVKKSSAMSSSPWSKWITTTSLSTLPQLLIGDGWAMDDTYRQIWMRLRLPGDDRDDVAGDKGKLLQTLKGHGFMFWPDVKDAPPI